MNRDETREARIVMEAYENGAEIERTPVGNMEEWLLTTNPVWAWFEYHYRIKKTPRTFWCTLYKNGFGSIHRSRTGADSMDAGSAAIIKVQEVIE